MPNTPDRTDAAPALAIPEKQPLFDLIELFYFAYRDFVDTADRPLETYHFGRAHHRVLYFIARRPGLTIAELLDILQITKQSLNRVLKELLEQNFVEAQAGVQDRRQRLLFATRQGNALVDKLAQLQSRHFERALAHCAPLLKVSFKSRDAVKSQEMEKEMENIVMAFLFSMIEPRRRKKIARHLQTARSEASS